MRNIKFIGVLLISVFMFVLNVKAVEPKVITNPVNTDGKFNFTTERDISFDYSKVTFSTDVSGLTITGSDAFKKIYSNYKTQCPVGDSSCVGGVDTYFTAYCLDGNKKYPEYEDVYLSLYQGNEEQQKRLFITMTIFQVLKECKANNCNLFDGLDGVTGYTYNDMSNGSYLIDEPDAATLAAFNLGDTNVTSYITKFYLTTKEGDLEEITALDLASALGASNYSEGKYSVTFKRNDFYINRYQTSSMPTTLGYNKALWIIEHSYPNLTLDRAVSKAGINMTELRSSIARLENIEETAENASEIDSLVQNYVYATTQYAIWSAMGDYFEMKSTGGSTRTKVRLGSTITNNDLLNKLYKYYLEPRDEYNNYGTNTFATGFNVKKPASGKELFQTTSDSYIYGPYNIYGKMLYTDSMNISIATQTTGVSLVDKAGNVLTVIPDNGEVYLKVLKTAKPSKVNLNVSTTTAYVFTSQDKRGSLYSSESVLDQIVATGGEIKVESVNGTLEILINPKTGVEDIGSIALVALVAFVLGYLVLKFKQAPIKEI